MLVSMSCGRCDLEIGDGPRGEETNPYESTFPLRQFVHNEARFPGDVDEDADLRFLDHDLCMKPRIAVGRGVDGFLVLAGLLFAQSCPRPVRMRGVLDCVGFSVCVAGAEVERAKVNQ